LKPHATEDYVLARKNILICGGTGTGKSTLLSILGKFIPPEERVLVIEDTDEIQLPQQDLVRFEARREQNGLPAVAIRDLLKAALRHRPDDLLNSRSHRHVLFRGSPTLKKAVEPRTTDVGQLAHSLDAQTALQRRLEFLRRRLRARALVPLASSLGFLQGTAEKIHFDRLIRR
jgi:energy-coupling factor transporter ATP-binding protein EcfA2